MGARPTFGLFQKQARNGRGRIHQTRFDSAKIRDLRQNLQLSQAVLAAVLNTSISTVRKWELGDKHPSGPSLKLLSLLERKGLEAVL